MRKKKFWRKKLRKNAKFSRKFVGNPAFNCGFSVKGIFKIVATK